MILWCKNNDKQEWNNYEQACRLPTAKSSYTTLRHMALPYALRSCNKLPIPRAKTNRYKNSMVFRAFSDRRVMDMYFI